MCVAGLSTLAFFSLRSSSSSPTVGKSGSPILSMQKELNKSSKNDWKPFSFHREKVMDLVQEASNKTTVNGNDQKPIAIFFGAGNCNDLNLSHLIREFHSIALVDIDDEATRDAVERQLEDHGEGKENIIVIPSMDLTNVIGVTQSWKHDYNKSPPQGLIEEALYAVSKPVPDDWLQRLGASESRKYDVAVSLCLLSQFADSLAIVLDERSHLTELALLVVSVRRRHFSQVIEALRPGGYGIMIIDMVSSDTLPELVSSGNTEIESLADQAEQTGNFFHGTRRMAVVQSLQSDFGNIVDNLQIGKPWKWNLGTEREYIVYSVVFRKKHSGHMQ